MTAIRHTLQKDLFEPDDERLVNVIHVIAYGRKRKPYFLCFTVTSQHPITLRLYQVKQGERGNTYSKKRVWFLRDIKVVDGINPRKPTPDFELTVDKPYRFTVTNANEKDSFIRQLYKFTAKYLPAQRPEFINVSLPVEELEFSNGAHVNVVSATASGAGIESVSQQGEDAEEYQPITVKEEQDFRRLLSKCQMTIGEAEKFADHLNRELSMLDGANIQAIMGGEVHIAELMNKIDQAIEEATMLEGTLDSYDALLAHVREGVETMEEKDKLLRTHANNRRVLMEELQSFVNLLDLSPENQKTLVDCNLSDPTKITRAAQAALALQKCMKAKVPPGMEKLRAYTDQMKLYQRISDQFAERLVAHLSALFRNLAANDNGWGGPMSPGSNLSLPRHDYIHAPLKPFSDLIMWLKHSVVDGYKMLLERYINAFKEVYRREFTTFFETAKQHVRISNFERKPTLVKGGQLPEHGRMVRSPSGPVDAGNVGSEVEQFRKLIEIVLKEIEPVVVAEQKFCIWWFHISSDLMTTIKTQSTGSNDSGPGMGGTPERRLEKQFNDQVRSILGQLFEQLDLQMQDFVVHCERANQVYLMQLLALLSNRAIAIQDSGIYLSTIFGKISVIVKRKFDSFMESQMQTLSEVRLLKRAKVGVLENLRMFEDLTQQAETAFQVGGRRGDLDRWYPALLAAVMDAIERAAEDPNSKAPPAVVRMENYHYLFSSLSQLKISCVDQQRKEAKQQYQVALDTYVKEYMGKPMEKLQNFFEQIETCIEQGMKPEDIGYQQAFNKQELRKAVAAYPVKEVGKGLDNLYKKIQKHLSDGESLLQVVWRNMQDEFIQQYKHYEQLIGQCYPNSNIQLEFSIQDVLQCFSDIAQQH